MGNCCTSQQDDQQDLLGDHVNGHADPHLIGSEDLPPGWKAVPSRSRPGKVAYQNIHTGERIAWLPTEPAATFKGAIKKKKKKTKSGVDKSSASGIEMEKLNSSSNVSQSDSTATTLKPV